MMHINDVVNGAFECVGGILVWHSVRRLLQAKRTLGMQKQRIKDASRSHISIQN